MNAKEARKLVEAANKKKIEKNEEKVKKYLEMIFGIIKDSCDKGVPICLIEDKNLYFDFSEVSPELYKLGYSCSLFSLHDRYYVSVSW